MTTLWKRFADWARGWISLPHRLWLYREQSERDAAAREKLMKIQAEIGGYGGMHYLEVAYLIASRLRLAENELGWKEDALKQWKQTVRQQSEELTRIRTAAGIPGLMPGEIERLALLAEECGEVARSVGKVLRWGWESESPYTGRTNREQVERDIGSVRAVVNLMLDAGDVKLSALQSWQRSKRGALARWTVHQECSIPREEQLEALEEIRSTRAAREQR